MHIEATKAGGKAGNKLKSNHPPLFSFNKMRTIIGCFPIRNDFHEVFYGRIPTKCHLINYLILTNSFPLLYCTEIDLQIGTANDNMSNVVDCVWRLIHEEEGRKLRKK